jgi:hypothetical protein
MRMGETALFAVLLARPSAPEMMTLAKALAAVRRTPVQDQIGTAKSAWGIIAENLPESEAQHLAQGLSAAGISAVAVEQSALVRLPEAKPLAQMDPSAAVDLSLVSVGCFTVTKSTTTKVKEGPNAAQKVLNTAILLGTGLPIKIGGSERVIEKTKTDSDRVFYADLHYGTALRRLRVDAQHFNYAHLKERKLYQVFGNFKLFMSDLLAVAPKAWRNRGAGILLDGKPIQTMGYESLADLERESRWLLTLQSKSGIV